MQPGSESDHLPARLLRIAEVAEEVGLTTRAIRYYEELGLLAPAARSEGAYRLYDADDVERLRLIKGLRDDAGFSLADIGRMVEDEAARARDRVRFRETHDPVEQERLLLVALERADRQLALLQEKAARLAAMVAAARDRHERLEARLAAVRAASAETAAPKAGR